VPGFSGASSACAVCLPCSAKHGNGNVACVQGAAGKFQDWTAAHECILCSAHNNTPGRSGSVAASACVNNPGYFNNNGVITACAPDTFHLFANQTASADCQRENTENQFYMLGNA